MLACVVRHMQSIVGTSRVVVADIFLLQKKKKKIGTQYITGRQNVVDGNGLKLRDEQLIARIVEGVAVGMQMLLNDFKKSFLFQ